MHSIHALPIHSDHHQEQQMQMQVQIQQHQHQAEAVARSQPSMAIIESLEQQPLDGHQIQHHLLVPQQQQQQQQLIGIMEATQQQQQQQQQPTLLVQPQVQHNQPQLHQLQPPNLATRNLTELTSNSNSNQHQQMEAELEPHKQQDGHRAKLDSDPNTNANDMLRQRANIEGIVTEGGGPIVQWLLDNYEIAEGESLPRSTVYNHYLAHCRQLQMASVNAASFGKLIRSVFVGLKTRRLGTRGHSKYHYFGVRAKQHIQQELLQHQESTSCSRDILNENSNQNNDNASDTDQSYANGLDNCGRLNPIQSSGAKKRARREPHYRRDHHYQDQLDQSPNHHSFEGHNQLEQHHLQNHNQNQNQSQHQDQLGANSVYYDNVNTNDFAANKHNSLPEHSSHCELADMINHLGANWSTLVDEHWPQQSPNLADALQDKCLGSSPEMTLAEALNLFEAKYKSYYKRMVEFLSELKFMDVEQLWFDFWRPTEQQQQQQHQPTPDGCHQATNHWMHLEPQDNHNIASEHQQQHIQSDNQQNQVQQQAACDINDMTNRRHQDQQHHHHNQQQHILYNNHMPEVDLTFQLLYEITRSQLIVERINRIDYSLYAALESFLLPDMLSPMPRPLTQHIRLFAKNFASWIESAVRDYEHEFATEKSKSARAFGYTLRRYTSLNHLSTASRAIWEKRSALAQLSLDLSRVDLGDIELHASLVSNGIGTDNSLALNSNSSASNMNNFSNHNSNSNSRSDGLEGVTNENNNLMSSHPRHLCALQPAQLIQNFLHLLEDPYPANSWPDWCRNLVESRVCGLSLEEAKNFVFKWNYYINLIMNDLTLRSAPSLGSFQLIKLLFDKYMYYLVVSRLAQAQHKTPAQLLMLM